jgi:hypothetical protein
MCFSIARAVAGASIVPVAMPDIAIGHELNFAPEKMPTITARRQFPRE